MCKLDEHSLWHEGIVPGIWTIKAEEQALLAQEWH